MQEYGLPDPVRKQTHLEILRKTFYSIYNLMEYMTENELEVLTEQWIDYNGIIQITQEQKGGLFFLDAPT